MDRQQGVNAAVQVANAGMRRDTLILLLVAGVLFFWKLGSHDLWPPDELRFALEAHEMYVNEDYAVLSLNDRLYTDKPPLFFWVINGLAFFRGEVDEWTARLPSALSGLIILLLIYRLGVWLFDRRAGLVGALIFATSLQIFVRARWASIDMMLTLFILSAILLLWRGTSRPAAGQASLLFGWACMGFATLAKGPVGLLLPILALLPPLLYGREWKGLRRLFSPAGIVLFLLITLSWFGLFAWRIGFEHALETLTRQNFERYFDAWNAQHPVWYYAWRFPAGFFPWIVFLPAAVVHAFKGEKGEERMRRALFLTGWIVTILIFFSFSTGKRGVYIIPIYPAAALLVGRLFTHAAEAGSGAALARRRLRVPIWIWAVGAGALSIFVPIVAVNKDETLLAVGWSIGLTLLAGAVAALIVFRRGRSLHAAGALCASLGIVVLLMIEGVLPWVNRYENISSFASRIERHLSSDIPFGSTEKKREAWVFYTGRTAFQLDSREEVVEFLAGGPPRDLLIDESRMAEIRPELPAGLRELVRGEVAGREFQLLRWEGGS